MGKLAAGVVVALVLVAAFGYWRNEQGKKPSPPSEVQACWVDETAAECFTCSDERIERCCVRQENGCVIHCIAVGIEPGYWCK